MTAWEGVAARHVQPAEVLHGAVPAFTGGGFGRRIVGVTDRRVLMIKSSYLRFSDGGLLWADDVDHVRLSPDVIKTNAAGDFDSVPSGNAYMTLARADGTLVELNVRRGFLFLPQTDRHLATLFGLIPGRIQQRPPAG